MTDANQTRRDFGKQLAAGAAAALGNSVSQAADAPKTTVLPTVEQGSTGHTLPPHRLTSGSISANAKFFNEAAREVPVAGSSDVVVCGGGPAGIAAALAAARSGANVRLLEVNGCIGGVWTAGGLSLVIDLGNKQGIMRELRLELEKRSSGHFSPNGSFVYDAEMMKVLLEEMLVDAGVAIQLHTRVVATLKDDNNRVAAVVTESKSGRQTWLGKMFVDCTGDGDLAALAGCQFDVGNAETGATQPMSLMGLMVGPKLDEIAQFVNHVASHRGLGRAKTNLLAEMRRAGVDPSYHGPTIFCVRDGMYAMMANHQYNVSATDAAQVTQATLEARREVHRLVDALRKAGGVWKDLYLVTTAEQIGTREGRRIRGLYSVHLDDLAQGATFDDPVCQVRFGIDVHSTDPTKNKEIEKKPVRSKPYEIPLRSMIAADVNGLMMAGRCISGDFFAHSSYRVTGNAAAMGEAAGIVAALAAGRKQLPQQIPFGEIAPKLPYTADRTRKS